MVDLGLNNYDREFAYIHPAIVIKETSRLGKTSAQFFDKIYNKLFEQIFESIHYKMQKLENNQ